MIIHKKGVHKDITKYTLFYNATCSFVTSRDEVSLNTFSQTGLIYGSSLLRKVENLY